MIDYIHDTQFIFYKNLFTLLWSLSKHADPNILLAYRIAINIISKLTPFADRTLEKQLTNHFISIATYYHSQLPIY